MEKRCGNCEHCGMEGFGAYFCKIDIYGSMYVGKNSKCKFNPSRFKGVEKVKKTIDKIKKI